MSHFRYCLPEVAGRGAGLGNEMIPWARAFLAAQLLGARALAPAFGLNRRRYWRHFGSSRLDWLGHRALKAALPVVAFTESDYLRHGGGDVVSALRGFAREQSLMTRKAFVLSTGGMWGGMQHIEAARGHMASLLYQSRFAAGNLLRLRERLDPGRLTVGLHVRQGDFEPARDPAAYRGQFNVALPLAWYRRVAASIHQQLEGAVQFLIVSDARPEQLQDLSRGLPCVFSGDLPDSDCSDLLALAEADLLVCSISSYSVWAAFLSRAPYLWYGPNLHEHPEGFLSIWGHEPGQEAEPGGTFRALQACQGVGRLPRRCFAIADDGQVTAQALDLAWQLKGRAETDLIRYGVIPAASGREAG
ncbi:hypothetical protein [Roseateles flavus]|uniref:Glycosyl transferase family 11 n=1 Tax=Roseateles flavus TaxID=3149041 RepID=A0ABV0GAN7_9BURK